jgi:hypothetical protein
VQVRVSDAYLRNNGSDSVEVIVATDTSFEALHLEVAYEMEKLVALGVDTGQLPGDCILSADLSEAGKVRVEAVCPAPQITTGPLFRLVVQANASCGDSTFVDLLECAVDAGARPCQATGAALSVGCPVSGKVRYHSNGYPVDNVALDLLTEGVTTVSSGGDGDFVIAAAAATTSVLTPRKSGAQNGAITSIDASVVLQAATGLLTTTPLQRLAADANGNGTLTAIDAALILQYRVGLIAALPVSANCGQWGFVPAATTTANQQLIELRPAPPPCQKGAIIFPPLTEAAAGQDFLALLFGDANGSWRPAQAIETETAVVQVGRFTRASRGRRLRVPIRVDTGLPLRALDLRVDYDPTQISRLRVRRAPGTRGTLLAVNRREVGQVKIAMAGAESFAPGWVLWLDVLPAVPRLSPEAIRVVDVVAASE